MSAHATREAVDAHTAVREPPCETCETWIRATYGAYSWQIAGTTPGDPIPVGYTLPGAVVDADEPCPRIAQGLPWRPWNEPAPPDCHCFRRHVCGGAERVIAENTERLRARGYVRTPPSDPDPARHLPQPADRAPRRTIAAPPARPGLTDEQLSLFPAGPA